MAAPPKAEAPQLAAGPDYISLYSSIFIHAHDLHVCLPSSLSARVSGLSSLRCKQNDVYINIMSEWAVNALWHTCKRDTSHIHVWIMPQACHTWWVTYPQTRFSRMNIYINIHTHTHTHKHTHTHTHTRTHTHTHSHTHSHTHTHTHLPLFWELAACSAREGLSARALAV